MDEATQVIDQVIDGILSNAEETIQKLQELSQKQPEAVQQLVQGIQAKADEGNEDAEQAIEIIKKVNASQKAAHGAKLQYIKKLQGICPEGYEMAYFKAGGKVCSKCMKVQKKVKKNCGGSKIYKQGGVSTAVNNFRTERASRARQN